MIILDETDLSELPGIVRTITIINECSVKIEFEFWGENEAGLTFSRTYADGEAAKQSVARFISESKELQIGMPGETSNQAFDNVRASKIRFFKDIIDGDVSLPEGGQGYEFEGSKEHLAKLISYLTKD